MSNWKGTKGTIDVQKIKVTWCITTTEKTPLFGNVVAQLIQNKYDAELFADALNTIQKCDLMPSQLLGRLITETVVNDFQAEKILELKTENKESLEENEKLKAQRDELIEFVRYTIQIKDLLIKSYDYEKDEFDLSESEIQEATSIRYFESMIEQKQELLTKIKQP